MREVGKILLWAVVAVIAVVVLFIGLVAYQLSQLYPDEGEGRRIAESVESDLLARYPERFHVDVSSQHPFGEVSAELSPVSGDLAGADLGGVLTVLAEHSAGLEGSDWRLVARVNGDWSGLTVVIHGVDATHWAALKGVLDGGVSPWREVAFDLDAPGIAVGREFRESYCEPGIGQVWRGFYESLLEATSDTLHELPHLPDGGAPELATWGSACGDASRLRYSVELGVEGPRQRIGDVREMVASLPDEVALSTLALDRDGTLRVEVRRPDGAELPASAVEALGLRLDAGWSHGHVRVNGHAAGKS